MRHRIAMLGVTALAGALAVLPAGPVAAGCAHTAPDAESTSADDDNDIGPDEFDRVERDLRARLKGVSPAPSATVRVHVHSITASDGTGEVTEETAAKQIDVLNDAYDGGTFGGADTTIDFELADYEVVADDTWFSAAAKSADYWDMIATLRVGGVRDLNIFYSDVGASGLNGRSSFPWNYTAYPDRDAVSLDDSIVPGGPVAAHNKGRSAVHEVGHWLGLLHVFQGGCADPNDGVADTAPQASATDHNCPAYADTCPFRAGTDNIHNFMDYSSDTCRREFTNGQNNRVADMWAAYRAP